MTLKIFCNICQKELIDLDFMFEARWEEIMVSLGGTEMTPTKQKRVQVIHICKGCFYKHISKLLKKNEKD